MTARPIHSRRDARWADILQESRQWPASLHRNAKGCPFSPSAQTARTVPSTSAMLTRTKLNREEELEREEGRREAAPPPAPVAQILQLQRTMGNQAAMALMTRTSARATVARDPDTAQAPQANASISQ